MDLTTPIGMAITCFFGGFLFLFVYIALKKRARRKPNPFVVIPLYLGLPLFFGYGAGWSYGMLPFVVESRLHAYVEKRLPPRIRLNEAVEYPFEGYKHLESKYLDENYHYAALVFLKDSQDRGDTIYRKGVYRVDFILIDGYDGHSERGLAQVRYKVVRKIAWLGTSKDWEPTEVVATEEGTQTIHLSYHAFFAVWGEDYGKTRNQPVAWDAAVRTP